MIRCGCSIGMHNIITMTALSGRINGAEAVSWCGVGWDQLSSLIVTEQHSMFAVAE